MFQRLDGKAGLPWYKITVRTSVDYVEQVAVERDGSVIFTDSAATSVKKWHQTDYTYNSGAISPYLKTQNVIADPTKEVLIDKVQLFRPVVGTTGTFDCKLYLGGSLAQTFATLDKTKKYVLLKMIVTNARKNRELQVEYNTNASPEYSPTTKVQIGGVYVYGFVLPAPNVSQ
jgi:hypothetical protein